MNINCGRMEYVIVQFFHIQYIKQMVKFHMAERIRELDGNWYRIRYWNDANSKRHEKILECYGKYKPLRFIPKLLQGDVLEKLQEIPNNSIDLAFADPPYNVGIDYGTNYQDNKNFDDYINWTNKWINITFKKLRDGGSFYYMNYPRNCAYVQVKTDIDKLMKYRKTIRWCYESSVGMSPYNYTTASRDILFYTKGNKYTFNRDKILIPYRNLNDKRIIEQMKKGSKGKAPYDYWFYNLVKNVSNQKITNIVNKKENTPPNQLPEELIKQIILASSNRGDTVLSLFAGSGTDLAVCCDLILCRKAVGIELNPYYCEIIQKRLDKIFSQQISNLITIEKWKYDITSDFKEDLKFSETPSFRKAYDNFYMSDTFKEKYLAGMYKTRIPTVKEIIRSRDMLLQKGVGIDAIVVLTNGTSLPIDEKTDRHIHSDSENIFLEIMSNPNSEYQTEGWAYHRGRYISYSCSNKDKSGLCYEPVFFFIDDNFINQFNRNKKYPTIPCRKKTNGLYGSIGKLVPRKDIIDFMCNGGTT